MPFDPTSEHEPDVDARKLWPKPDPAHGDGSDFGESEDNDGTPGAV